MDRDNFEGKGRPIVKYSDTLRSFVQKRLAIEMPFGLWTQVGQLRKHVLDGGQIPIQRVNY